VRIVEFAAESVGTRAAWHRLASVFVVAVVGLVEVAWLGLLVYALAVL
jgi:hypothetical protein